MKTLITGGSGFLGRHLCDLLPDADAPTSSELDITGDCSAVGDYELVFHLAAQTLPQRAEEDPAETMNVNVNGTRRLLHALAPASRLVFVSTCHVYGLPQSLPITESHPRTPRGIYASSKLAAERLVEGRAVVARPFNLTGPGQAPHFALADWALQGKAGKQRIRCGNVDLERDYLDVRDAAEGLVLLSQLGSVGEAYNLCSGNPYRLRQLLVVASGGGEPDPDPKRWRTNDVPTLVGSAEKARGLGWAPRYTISESLEALRASLP